MRLSFCFLSTFHFSFYACKFLNLSFVVTLKKCENTQKLVGLSFCSVLISHSKLIRLKIICSNFNYCHSLLSTLLSLSAYKHCQCEMWHSMWVERESTWKSLFMHQNLNFNLISIFSKNSEFSLFFSVDVAKKN